MRAGGDSEQVPRHALFDITCCAGSLPHVHEDPQAPLETDPTLAGRVDFIGPIESHLVSVDGWEVPLLDATPLQGGRVMLNLDRRFGLELDLAEAERIVPFIAQAIAVASGFSSHPSGDRGARRIAPHEARRLTRLDVPPGEADETSI
jgi:hypothetical protein